MYDTYNVQCLAPYRLGFNPAEHVVLKHQHDIAGVWRVQS